MRVESNETRSFGHEVRQSVDVVKNNTAIAIVCQIFHAAGIDARMIDNFLDRVDHVARWRACLHFQSSLGCIGIVQADLSRTKIKVFAAGEDIDRVKKLSAQRFDARNMAAARRDKFLDKGDLIDPQFQLVLLDEGPEMPERIETHDAGAAPTDVWLNQQRESKLRRRHENFVRAIDDASIRKTQT